MAGRIRDEDIAAVRERSPIDEVIGEYLQLRSAGGDSLKGLCPFHDEKTPSFNVTPGRGLYYCFSCGEGGDVAAGVTDPGHGEGLQDDRPVRAARHRGYLRQFTAEQLGEHQPVQVRAQAAAVNKSVIDIPQDQELARGHDNQG